MLDGVKEQISIRNSVSLFVLMLYIPVKEIQYKIYMPLFGAANKGIIILYPFRSPLTIFKSTVIK